MNTMAEDTLVQTTADYLLWVGVGPMLSVCIECQQEVSLKQIMYYLELVGDSRAALNKSIMLLRDLNTVFLAIEH